MAQKCYIGSTNSTVKCNEQDRTVRESRSVLPERLEFNRVINGDTVKLERSQYFSIKKEFPRT